MSPKRLRARRQLERRFPCSFVPIGARSSIPPAPIGHRTFKGGNLESPSCRALKSQNPNDFRQKPPLKSSSYRQIRLSCNQLQCYLRAPFRLILLKSKPLFRYVESLPQFFFGEFRRFSDLLRCTNDLPEVPIGCSVRRPGGSPAISQQSTHSESSTHDAFS